MNGSGPRGGRKRPAAGATTPIDPLGVPLSGRHVVVASAGTGKTHALTRLFLRLLLERGLTIDRILVVTFTDAATRELRDRLRRFLGIALEVARRLESSPGATPAGGDGSAEDDCAELLGRCAEPAAARRLLDSALRSFDEASVFTIHGFCQRVLSESAFECGGPFSSELVPDAAELVRESVDDFWRRRFAGESPGFVDFVARSGLDPARLADFVKRYFDRPDLELRALEAPSAVQELERRHDELCRAMAEQWREHRAEILSDAETPGIRKQTSAAMRSPTRLSALDRALAGSGRVWMLAADVKHLRFFSRAKIVGPATPPKVLLPERPFYRQVDDFLSLREELSSAWGAMRTILEKDALVQARAEMQQRRRERGLRGYSDLLLDLRTALRAPGSGDRLAANLRQRFAAALIDECQDTDPVQTEIIDRIWPAAASAAGQAEPPVFLVGDPKQAIYGFRGADVFAFLASSRQAQRRWSLGQNWRSDELLVQGVNALFRGSERPFVLDEIGFTPATWAHPGRRLRVRGDDGPPLRLRRLGPGGAKPEVLSNGAALQLATAATAAEIERLLRLGNTGAARLHATGDGAAEPGEPLRGGDVAVLVRTGAEAAAVRAALLERGIPSVLVSDDSVLASDEAEDLRRVLTAVADPRREGLVRAALATTLLGWDAARLAALRSDDGGGDAGSAQTAGSAELAESAESAGSAEPAGSSGDGTEPAPRWSDVLGRFQDWHGLWRDHGIARALRQILLDEAVPRRLLERLDGERRMTNVLHLGELLQAASRNGRVGMEGLLEWLAARQGESSTREEEQQLRLESDENLVQIATIHKAKGLEYPVVFCPYLWSSRVRADKRTAITFHETAGAGNGAAVLQLLPKGAGHPARQPAMREELAEELRLAYVALTRARHRCEVVWIDTPTGGQSPLGWLLGSGSAAEPGASLTLDAIHSGMAVLASAAPEALLVTDERDGAPADQDGEVARQSEGAAGEPLAAPVAFSEAVLLPARRPPSISPGWRFASYTSLIHERPTDAARSSREADLLVARPERDQRTGDDDDGPPTLAPRSTPGLAGALPVGEDIHALQGGFRTGDCLHQIFQSIDFPAAAREDLPATSSSGLAAVVSLELERHRFDAQRWREPVTAMVRRVLATPLDAGGSLRLQDVTRARRVDELGFTLPVTELRMGALRRVLRRHGFAAGRFDAAVDALSFDDVRGFLRGSIDLVFEHQGRWFVVDWKSSRLGSGLDDYGPDRVDDAMRRHDYWLQYLIYVVALHRMLGLRVPDYDPGRHLGGVHYLFVRGMEPARGPASGVFTDLPPAELVRDLDRLLGPSLRAGATAVRS